MRGNLRQMQKELGITFIHVTHTQMEAIAVPIWLLSWTTVISTKLHRARGLFSTAQYLRGEIYGWTERLFRPSGFN